MKVIVLAVGEVRGPLGEAVRTYVERATRYWKIDVVEVADAQVDRPEEARRREAAALVARLPDEADVWALTRTGKGMTSRALSTSLESRAVRAGRDLVFVVGGAFGLGPAVLACADRKLSLSPMTLPHDLARLVLLEQLYRAGTIRRGEPYHKGD